MAGHMGLICYFLLLPKALHWGPALCPVFSCFGVFVLTLLPEHQARPADQGAAQLPAGIC